MTDSELGKAQAYLDEVLIPFLSGEVSAGEVLGLDPGDLERIMRLGISAYATNLNDRAATVFDVVTRLEPRFYLGHLYLGLVKEKQGDLETAARSYERAGVALEAQGVRSKEQEDALIDVTLLISRVLLRLGRVEEASEYLLNLSAQRDRLDPTIRTQLDAFLGHAGQKKS
jgi:tetratricopeptide (TPR) repeat protein